MPLAPKLVRLSLAAVLFASLGACTVVPVHPVGYRAPPPVYVESYERHYREPQRGPSPLESAARTHRDVRRSLGLPRLPGMP